MLEGWYISWKSKIFAISRGGTSNEKFWAHLTEASIWVIDRILINKNCILLISRLPRPSFWATFDQKMEKFRVFSYYSSTTAPRKVILDMHTHISPSYNNWSLTLTSKVTGGHLEVIRGQKGQYIYFFVNYLLDQSFTLHTHIISLNNVSIKKLTSEVIWGHLRPEIT